MDLALQSDWYVLVFALSRNTVFQKQTCDANQYQSLYPDLKKIGDLDPVLRRPMTGG
jgi:hypothetical protein